MQQLCSQQELRPIQHGRHCVQAPTPAAGEDVQQAQGFRKRVASHSAAQSINAALEATGNGKPLALAPYPPDPLNPISLPRTEQDREEKTAQDRTRTVQYRTEHCTKSLFSDFVAATKCEAGASKDAGALPPHPHLGAAAPKNPVKPKLDVEAVLALWNNSGWTLDEIAAHLDRPRTTVHGAIRRAQAKGLARRGTYPKPVEAPPLAALWDNPNSVSES